VRGSAAGRGEEEGRRREQEAALLTAKNVARRIFRAINVGRGDATEVTDADLEGR
jgi:hypothetical protein